jgi:hypothetical protein
MDLVYEGRSINAMDKDSMLMRKHRTETLEPSGAHRRKATQVGPFPIRLIRIPFYLQSLQPLLYIHIRK